ncbi:protein of unknown function [Methylotuvimicrobium alcaliphilum 20Z]|uniref:Uncharacterized protein n=1 Tax=Methylotuvimicrobium alcaliphilum (strain DSM 19304 / NCIMB 14124 / VKM B-2133 / 20Z) TaxID=1091494 RepID=G4T361_META2|nr:protein of unknown function [Methylotuvimicrobium alcaliphilum 20Z]
MQILQEQKSALSPTPANRVTEPAYPQSKIGKLFITKSLGLFVDTHSAVFEALLKGVPVDELTISSGIEFKGKVLETPPSFTASLGMP